MQNKLLMITLVSVLALFGGCVVLFTEDSEALHNGSAEMQVAQGGTSTYTWAQASTSMASNSSYDNQPFYTHNLSYGVANSSSVSDGDRVSGLTITWNASGLSLAANSSVPTGTYYIEFSDWTTEEDLFTLTFSVVAAGSGSGSGSGSGTVNYTSPSAVDALTGSTVTYRPTVNVASSTFSTTTVTGKTNASWLTLSNGVLSGTAPSVSSMTTYYYSIEATTPGGQQAVQTVSFNVYPVAQIADTVSTSYNLTQNSAMTSITLAGNVNMTFGKSGNLPAGVSLSGTTISGTPTEFGDFTITLKGFTTAGPSQTATKKITFHVAEQTMTITSEAPTGIYYSGKNYTYSPTVNISAGCTWSLNSSYDWLVLSNGVVTGTIPSDISVTSISYTLTATSAGGQVKSQSVTFDVEKTAAFTSVPTAACVVIPVYTYEDDGSFSILGSLTNCLMLMMNAISMNVDGGVAGVASFDNGTSNMEVVQGSSATYTWPQALDGYEGYETHEWEIFVSDSGTDYGNTHNVQGISVTYNTAGITLTCAATVPAGTYYIWAEDHTTEDDLLTASFVVLAATPSGSGSGSSGSGTSGGTSSGGSGNSGSGTSGGSSSGTSGGSSTPVDTGDDSTTIYSDGTRTFKFVWTGEDADTVLWDFGDGTTGQGFTIYHTYSENGTYTYTCTGVNDNGTDRVTGTIVVDVPLMKHILSEYLWYIVAAIILVIAIAVFVLFRRKRNARLGGYYY
ncbi:MAG: PKD domain-containing protein [Candidatus Methanomethylophilaceae archaeon]|nr:PKD domain-containing protein [Candidatus Methanomethylophilaceae archaeon]